MDGVFFSFLGVFKNWHFRFRVIFLVLHKLIFCCCFLFPGFENSHFQFWRVFFFLKNSPFLFQDFLGAFFAFFRQLV